MIGDAGCSKPIVDFSKVREAVERQRDLETMRIQLQIDDYLRKAQKERIALLEEVCEKALASERYGVAVWTWDEFDGNRFASFTVAKVSGDAPYATIYYHPHGVRPEEDSSFAGPDSPVRFTGPKTSAGSGISPTDGPNPTSGP